MTHTITFKLDITLPKDLNAWSEAERIKADISRESGYAVRVVSVLKEPEVKGIKIEGLCKTCQWFKVAFGHCQWCTRIHTDGTKDNYLKQETL